MNTIELELLDDIASPIFILKPDSNGDIVYAAFNKTALNIVKIKPNDILGYTALHVYQGEYGQYAYQQHQKAFKTGQPNTYVLSLPLAGKICSIRTHLEPKSDSDGNVTHLIGSSVDISAELELKEIRAQTREVTKELEEFMYLAAHDLRSPMRNVRMLADFLREDFKDMGDGKLELIDSLEKISIQAMSLVEDVLQHAEITGVQESIETFKLSDLCSNIFDMLDPNNATKRCIDNAVIFGDRVATQIILRNLIDNVLKHNVDTPISLNISAKKEGAGFFSVTVADNGQGMLNPNLLFEGGSRNRSKSGFGLLAVRRLVKLRGGDIFADAPIEGTGLNVTFSLPGTVTSAGT